MRTFLYGVGGTTITGILLVILAKELNLISNEIQVAVFTGFGLALVFVLSGFFLFLNAMKSTIKKFNKTVVIGIIVRVLLIAAAIIAIFIFTKINRAGFLISLFVSYFIFHVWGVSTLNKLSAKGI